MVRREAMSIFTIQNHVHFTLLSLTIAPSTAIAIAVLLFIYLYIIHVRKTPLPLPLAQLQPPAPAPAPADIAVRQHPDNYYGDDHRGAGHVVRRPSFLRRISARLRIRRQRDQPVAPLPLPFSPIRDPLRHHLGNRSLGFWRQIQPARVETGRRRQPKQRLLE